MARGIGKQDSDTNSNRKSWAILGHCCVSLRQAQVHLGRSEKIFAFSLAPAFCVSFIAFTLCIPSTVSHHFFGSTPSFLFQEMEELQPCHSWLMCLELRHCNAGPQPLYSHYEGAYTTAFDSYMEDLVLFPLCTMAFAGHFANTYGLPYFIAYFSFP